MLGYTDELQSCWSRVEGVGEEEEELESLIQGEESDRRLFPFVAPLLARDMFMRFRCVSYQNTGMVLVNESLGFFSTSLLMDIVLPPALARSTASPVEASWHVVQTLDPPGYGSYIYPRL